jgi:hypothetical protein
MATLSLEERVAMLEQEVARCRRNRLMLILDTDHLSILLVPSYTYC